MYIKIPSTEERRRKNTRPYRCRNTGDERETMKKHTSNKTAGKTGGMSRNKHDAAKNNTSKKTKIGEEIIGLAARHPGG